MGDGLPHLHAPNSEPRGLETMVGLSRRDPSSEQTAAASRSRQAAIRWVSAAVDEHDALSSCAKPLNQGGVCTVSRKVKICHNTSSLRTVFHTGIPLSSRPLLTVS
jgi:hypothetical protein